MAQLSALDGSYHGGLAAYIANAKRLLQDSKEGRNPFEGYTPKVPHGEKIDYASPGQGREMGKRQEGSGEIGRGSVSVLKGASLFSSQAPVSLSQSTWRWRKQAWSRRAGRPSFWWPGAWVSGWATRGSRWRCRQRARRERLS